MVSAIPTLDGYIDFLISYIDFRRRRDYKEGMIGTGKMIRRFALSALIGVLFLSLASCIGPFDPINSPSIADLEAKIFKLVNDHRLSIGRPALVWNDIIAGEERTHSQQMANGQVPLGHDGFYDRIDRINESIPWSFISENVALAGSAEDAMDAWMKSPEHLVIIEGDYDLTGVGVAKGTLGSVYYFSQMFLKLR
jgi:uncharacterized protein YkwD